MPNPSLLDIELGPLKVKLSRSEYDALTDTAAAVRSFVEWLETGKGEGFESYPSLKDGLDRLEAVRNIREAKEHVERTCGEWDCGVYVLKDPRPEPPIYKIGKSRRLGQRLWGLIQESGYVCRIVRVIDCRNRSISHHRLELKIHAHLAGKRLHGEWFALDPADLEWLEHYDNSST